MSSRGNEDNIIRLVVAITDFLRDELERRTDLALEDRDCLEIAIQCLEMAYGLDANGYLQYRFARPLVDIFSQVINPVSVKDKLQADAHKDEGNAYMRRSMYTAAEDSYTSAIELDRWNSIYYCNRASSRIEQRNFFDAIADCRQALLLNPDYAKAYARMGQAYALIHRPREAARCFSKALELEPDNERYRTNLRVAQAQITRPDTVGIITSVLNSLFRIRPQISENTNSRAGMPTSFMIITESHPPTVRNVQAQRNVHQPRNRSQIRTQPDSESNNLNIMNNIEYHPRFGIFDEGTEEQPAREVEIPQSALQRNVSDDDIPFSIEIPLFSFEICEESDSSPDECTDTTNEKEHEEIIQNEIDKVQDNLRAQAGVIGKDDKESEACESSRNDRDINVEGGKQNEVSTTFSSERPGEELLKNEMKYPENGKSIAVNDKISETDILPSAEHLSTVEKQAEKSVTSGTKSAEIMKEDIQSGNENLISDNIVDVLDSIISIAETDHQYSTSTNCEKPIKSSTTISDETEKNVKSKESIEVKTSQNFLSHAIQLIRNRETEQERTQPQQFFSSTENDGKSAENIEQGTKDLGTETKETVPSDKIEKFENTGQSCKTSVAETNIETVSNENDKKSDQDVESSETVTKRNGIGEDTKLQK